MFVSRNLPAQKSRHVTNMPALVRKLLVFAAGDGLVLKPLHPRPQSQRCLKIEYGSYTISSKTDFDGKDVASFECHGIVGTGSISAFS